MTKVKSNPPKQTTTNNQFELIDLDLVKSEPDETVSSPVTTTSVAKSQNDNANQDYVGNPIVIAPHVSPRAVGKPVPVALNVPAGTAIQQANYTLTGATSGQPSKTFLLINNRTGVQSMLLSGNAVGRKPFSGVIESSQLPQIRVRTSAGGMQTIVSNQGPRTSSSSLVVAQKQSESGTSSRMIMDGGTISAVRPCINASEFQSRPASTVSDIIFTSRSIDPDGTVKTIKEYLCNFCQYKVSVQSEFEAHKSTHTFSCNHCKFKALTRFDVLKHKKQKHLNCSEELAGYHDLDKLMESVSAAQVFTTTSSPTTSSVPPQLYTAEPQRPPSSEPPLLELQNVPLSLAASLERSPTVAAANDDPKVPDENFDEESRKSDSMDSGTQNSRNVVGSSTEAPAVDAKETTTRLSRPRRAVAEKKMTLRDMDSDSQAELDNKTDDDDWEEKVPKNSGKKRSRKVLDPNKVAKTPEALKTLLDQPTQDQADTPRRLSCMRYKCSSCPFETVNTLALSEHIKTHDVSQNLDPSKSQTTSANKIMRDPNQPLSAVHWSCFYCNLSSVSQATIVSHVMKAHPGNAIQLKRISVPQTLQQLQSYPESSAAAATSADNSQTLVPGRTSPPVQAQNAAPNQQHQPIKQGTVTKSRASNPENEGCLWGCYYCNIQSVERSEVIAHLKREHHDLKLIVTRRRITHIPANFKAANKDSETEKLAEEKSDSVDAGKNKEPQDEICGGDSEKTAPSSERDDEAKGRPSKRKSSGGKKKKSLVNVSSEPRVLRSRRVSPGSLSPSLRDGSPSHVSVNSSEGMGPPSKKRKGRQDDHDKSSCGTPSAAGDTEVGDYNESKQAEQQQLDKQKTIFVRKILDYPKPLSMKSLMEELRWKCSFCEFKTGSRSKVVYHNMSNHPEKPVRFHRLLRGRALDCGESFNSRLRGPRSARETNLLKNGNWLWQCPVCDRKHISKGYLNVHLKVAHPRQASRLVGLAPSRKCKSVRASEDKTKRCSISLVRAEDMVHYDSLSNVLLDNGLSLVKSLDVDDDLECDVVRHRKYKCGKCNVRGFRPMIVKQHFLEAHSATEVLVLDLKNSQKNKYGDGCTLYSCLKGDCKFFTANKTELEGHYNDYAEHARTGPHQVERRRGLNGSDSEITDPSFERTSENRPVECRDSVAAKDVPGHLSTKADVATQQLSSPAVDGGSNNNSSNNVRTIFLTPKNSDIASGLSMLKKTLSSTQVMKLSKPNGPDDQQQQSQAHPIEIDLLQSSIPPSDQSRGMFDVLTNSSSLGQHNLSAQSPQQQVISRGYHGTSGSAPVQVCDQSGDDKFKYTVDGKLLRKPRRCTSPKYVDRYQCVVCGQRMGQLNQMKQHLLLCHSNIWKEKAFCIDVRARELRKRQKILFCLQEKCGFYCKNDFELSTHETSIGDCPVPISKPGVSGLESEFLGFSCYEPVPITIESSSEDNNNVNGKFHNDDDASWNRLKCNKSYQCSYCTFTTLDLLSIKSHVVSQHKHDIPSCSASLASARRAGFSEIATKMTSDGNFVTSVNDRRVDGVSDDEENDVDDKQRGIIRDALNRSEVGTLESGNVGENGDEGTIAPAMDGGKVYTVL